MSKYIAAWPALTADPDLLNQLMYDLGLRQDFALQDIFDIETDLNDATALIIIFPESEDDEKVKDVEEQGRAHADPVSIGIPCFIKQNIDNACGMFAVINAILNSNARFSVGTHFTIQLLGASNPDQYRRWIHSEQYR